MTVSATAAKPPKDRSILLYRVNPTILQTVKNDFRVGFGDPIMTFTEAETLPQARAVIMRRAVLDIVYLHRHGQYENDFKSDAEEIGNLIKTHHPDAMPFLSSSAKVAMGKFKGLILWDGDIKLGCTVYLRHEDKRAEDAKQNLLDRLAKQRVKVSRAKK